MSGTGAVPNCERRSMAVVSIGPLFVAARHDADGWKVFFTGGGLPEPLAMTPERASQFAGDVLEYVELIQTGCQP